MTLRAMLCTATALAVAAPTQAQTPRRAPAAPVAATAALPPAAPADWRAVDPENTVVIETSKGRIVVELAPEAAPKHVERMKLLARAKFFDGVVFHRVIDHFMAQTGDPLGTGEGQSPYPDLEGEFTFRRKPDLPVTTVANPSGLQLGFLRSFPIGTQPDALMAMTSAGTVAAWGLYCSGVLGAARGDEQNSANSQFFLMRQPYPSLEKRYTAYGRVVSGLDVVRAIKTGEPVVDPDRMLRVRVLADIPTAERPDVRVLSTSSARFKAMVEQARRTKGADFSPCDVEVPAQVTGGA